MGAIDYEITALVLDAWKLVSIKRVAGDRPAIAALRNSPIQDSATSDRLRALLLFSHPTSNRASTVDKAAAIDATFDEPELAAIVTRKVDCSMDWESCDARE